MKRFLLTALGVVAALSGFAPSARADFASCVGSLRTQAAHSGISARTLDIAFNGLEPDPKVLDLQTAARVQDAGLGLCRRAGGRRSGRRRQGGDGEGIPAALARAEEQYGVSRYMLAAIWGVELNFGQEMGKRSLVQSLDDALMHGRSRQLFPLRIDGDAQDRRPRRRAGREAEWLMGGRVWADPIHALDLHAPRSRRRRGRARRDLSISAPDALSSTANYFRKSGWRSGLPWGFEVKLPENYSGPSGAQGQTIHVVLGLARPDPHRRAPAGRGRSRAAHTRGTRGAGLSGDAASSTSSIPTTPPNPTPSPPACSPIASAADAALSPHGRPTNLLLSREGTEGIAGLAPKARL